MHVHVELLLFLLQLILLHRVIVRLKLQEFKPERWHAMVKGVKSRGDLAIACVAGTPPRSCSSRDQIGTTAIHLCTGSGTPVQILKTLQNENFVLLGDGVTNLLLIRPLLFNSFVFKS